MGSHRSVIVLCVLALSACRGRAPDRAADPPAPAPAPAPRAHGPELVHDPSPVARELDAALIALDRKATHDWIDRARVPHPADQPFTEPMPDSAERAVQALLAWDRSGLPLRIDCPNGETHPEYQALRVVGTAALERATRADDPIVHAVLRFGQALRDRDNSPFAITVGMWVAADVAYWRARSGVPETDDMRAMAPDATLPRAAALTEVRCGAAMLAQLRGDPDAKPADLDEAAADLDETRASIARTASDTELGRLLHDRAERLGATMSPVIGIVAPPRAFDEIVSSLDRYGAARDGEDPDRY